MRAISTLSGKHLKSVDQFTYLGSNILSTESNVNIRRGKAWNAIEKLLIIWKYLSDINKTGLLRYGCVGTVIYIYIYMCVEARDVLGIFVENAHGEPSSNFGRGCLHFTLSLHSWQRHESNYPHPPRRQWVNSRID